MNRCTETKCCTVNYYGVGAIPPLPPSVFLARSGTALAFLKLLWIHLKVLFESLFS
jgi:hypothetical protein